VKASADATAKVRYLNIDESSCANPARRGPAVGALRLLTCDDEQVDEFTVQCPYCGEDVTIYLEADVRGTFVQDCEVCCNPWRLRVSGLDDERVVDVARADGSE
jgi:hypothetical protein